MDIYEINVRDINGNEVSMKDYKDKVLLIVNTASKCGFTNQYEGLQRLYEKYRDRGLVVMGFPSNQFGGQEPGDNEEIKSFCAVNFGINFPMFAKSDVNGENENPLYEFLKSKQPGRITWNFNKFLVDKEGTVVERFGSRVKPKKLEEEIEKLL